MSPLDNHAFGIAKAKMRANNVDESDRIEPSLVFLNALGSILPETVQAMWDRNLLLEHDEIDGEAVRKILRPTGKNGLRRLVCARQGCVSHDGFGVWILR
jgi:hypothetical protein